MSHSCVYMLGGFGFHLKLIWLVILPAGGPVGSDHVEKNAGLLGAFLYPTQPLAAKEKSSNTYLEKGCLPPHLLNQDNFLSLCNLKFYLKVEKAKIPLKKLSGKVPILLLKTHTVHWYLFSNQCQLLFVWVKRETLSLVLHYLFLSCEVPSCGMLIERWIQLVVQPEVSGGYCWIAA